MNTNLKRDFFKFQAKTTQFASGFEVDYAKGSYIYGKDGKAYLDFAAGVSVNTLGHSHPRVNQAIIDQVNRHQHVMVYGEYAQDNPVQLCKRLAEVLPAPLDTTYLVNSGTEAIEASMKLAKRYTGREEIIACKNAYHGNTHGSLSLGGREEKKRAFRPLLPMINFIEFNSEEDLNKITSKTAGVVVETIQGASGFRLPQDNYLKKLKDRCEKVGALLILDEIQPGFGRTGKLFAFEHYDFAPDVLVIGKGMASGMPIGAFVSSAEKMESLSHSPTLGHITTFGGNPVVAAAALATLDELIESDLMIQIDEKEKLFRKLLVHPKIKTVAGRGLMLAPELESPEYALQVAKKCMEKGLIVFWLMYSIQNLRITPPVTISLDEIKQGCEIILEVLNEN
ncbi:aspartate aminotransferase family protein [Moheibacter sediminis]|uniref:Acetylornithine/succinyldiaminopimelate/putrescine aminotransferase n=1 Tax=Moheibacter sediminis TaxID=1434700 RepID=A0A1W1ZED7_9FLAO|nr:aspartate aminotransferase family protein [Moheibacter sediminis]SMC46388.1 Acetylornithine/succinyldiaminopimelate/putrescine aminotransferase [Moheibacter sediminis]